MVIIQEIFDFLKAKGYYKTLFSLEEESGQLSFQGEEELEYIHKLISKGEFDRLSNILKDFCDQDKDLYKEGLLHIKTQSMLEKIEDFSNLDQIKKELLDLKSVCSQSHLKNIDEALIKLDLNEFANWEKWSGRFNCWENLQALLCPEEINEDFSISSSDHDIYSESYEKEDTVLFESVE